jgi:peptidylprolyl isomerase
MREMTRRASLPTVWLLVILVAILLGSCGSDGSPSSGDGGLATPSAPPVVSASGTKPTITIPNGAPPPTLQVKDITVGTGPEAVPGATVVVHYVGASWSTGQEFDASWDSGQPFPFVLGSGTVIPGWEQGVAGMKVGGRRQLVIPPDLAYGPEGRGPIGPNETLVFVIDLLAVQ